MQIKVWGCRGSIPSPGKESIKYGGESTCLEILTNSKQRIIIDAGSGIRKLGQVILNDKTNTHITLILTHAHWDHLMGFPFFMPAYFSKYSITLCGGPIPQNTLLNFLKHQMEAPFFPVEFQVLKANIKSGCHCDEGFCDHLLPKGESSIVCHSIPLNHPNGGFGFKFFSNDKSFVFLTDTEIRHKHASGLSRKEYLDFCKGVDLLFHDAQYTEEEYKKTISWGHSTYQDAVDFAIEAGVKSLGLCHHDPDRSDDDIDKQLNTIQNYILKSGSHLECFACREGMSLEL